jgi:hypothetical protein
MFRDHANIGPRPFKEMRYGLAHYNGATCSNAGSPPTGRLVKAMRSQLNAGTRGFIYMTNDKYFNDRSR